LTDDPGSAFATVWDAVVSELNGKTGAATATGTADVSAPALTPQQKAWLNLVEPLTIV
jgi:chromosomal replication initiator protein